VTLNRPEVLNATNSIMHTELSRIFREIQQDPETDVVVLTGAGKAFSAGGDIIGMLKGLDDQPHWANSMREAREILVSLVELDRPVIARINGHAVGLGATLALFCDITIASEKARIADPHVRVGLVAGDGGSLIWPLLVGHARAKLLLLTGESVTGAEAARIGLVTEAHPLEALDARVDEIADRLAAGSSPAIRGTKRAMNLLLRTQLEQVIDAHLGFETLSHLTPDHREAVHAFRDGRDPVFGAARQAV
jgi:enoyl-CoA hydratase